jgi:hypothetical protein
LKYLIKEMNNIYKTIFYLNNVLVFLLHKLRTRYECRTLKIFVQLIGESNKTNFLLWYANISKSKICLILFQPYYTLFPFSRCGKCKEDITIYPYQPDASREYPILKFWRQRTQQNQSPDQLTDASYYA